ncbi:HEAT repeat domain-containing protein [bacterium]|nr:HEAT repeat domain-containing protein [bacterium]
MQRKQGLFLPFFVAGLLVLFQITVSVVHAQDVTVFIKQQLKLLEDDDLLNDQQAIDALVAKGPVVLEYILAQFVQAGRDTKAALIETLGKLHDPRGFEPLKQELEKLDFTRRKAEVFADSYLRIMLIKALGDLGDQRAIPLLLKSKASDDIYEKTQALVALDSLQYQQTRSELEAIALGPDNNCRNIVVMGLGRKGNTEAVPLLLKALQDEVWFVRASAIDALVNVGDPAGLDPIKAMLDDRSPYVRQAAQDALATLGQSTPRE